MGNRITKIVKLFKKPKPEMHTKTDTPVKIFVGNARLDTCRGSMTLNMTEILCNKDVFRNATVDGNEVIFLDLTVLPFKKGKNRFGNTHYIILKNQ